MLMFSCTSTSLMVSCSAERVSFFLLYAICQALLFGLKRLNALLQLTALLDNHLIQLPAFERRLNVLSDFLPLPNRQPNVAERAFSLT